VPEKANEIKTFAHCQARVPEELMYRLHQLFWHHGRQCPRCRAETSEKSRDWGQGCPIENLVKRTGIMKDGKRRVSVNVEVKVEDDKANADISETTESLLTITNSLE
jgi:hypothetical protein